MWSISCRSTRPQAPGHGKQHARHGGQGQVGRQGRDELQDGQQQQRREHRRQRGASARCQVQATAVEGPAGRVGTEKRPGDVRQALANEFLVGIDALPGLDRQGAGDRQGLGQRQHGHGNRDRQHLADAVHRQVRQGQRRQAARQSANAGDAGVLHAHPAVQPCRQQAAGHQCGDHVRDARQVASGHGAGEQGENGHPGHPRVDLSDLAGGEIQGLGERGAPWHGQAKEMPELADRDQQGGARRETDDHRVRHKIHQAAQAQPAQGQLDHARQKRQRQRQLHKAGAARLGQGAEGGVHHDGNGGGGPCHQMPGRAEQRRHDHRHHGRVQAVCGRHARNRGKGHALRHQDQAAREPGFQIGQQRFPVDQGPPGQKRQKALQLLHREKLPGQNANAGCCGHWPGAAAAASGQRFQGRETLLVGCSTLPTGRAAWWRCRCQSRWTARPRARSGPAG